MTNTKKKHGNKMKLMSAIGMLTVSAAMLVSSTFAWFSMNKTVSAQTMSIQAKSADPIIEISADGGTTYANDLTTGTNWTLPTATGVKLKLVTPTAISSAGAVSWGWTSSTDHASAQKTNATDEVTLTAATTPAATNSGNSTYLGDGTDLYVLKQTLKIRNKSYDVAAANLTISEVKLNKGTNTIANAVRLLFVSDGKYAVYQPAASGTGLVLAEAGEAPWLTGTTPTATAMSTTTSGGTQAAGLPIVASALAANGGSATVDVYMYFDGTDDDAYTDLATDLTDVSATFKFSID